MYSCRISERRGEVTMVRFELKKILGKTGGKIALLLLAAIVVICCWLAVNVDYTDEQGNHPTGFASARKLRSMQKEWSGVLDEEMLRAVIAENQRITSLRISKKAMQFIL